MSSDTVGGIQGYLIKLHSFLGDTESRNAALVCHDIIGDLGKECLITKNENELGKNLFMQKKKKKSIALCLCNIYKKYYSKLFCIVKQNKITGAHAAD